MKWECGRLCICVYEYHSINPGLNKNFKHIRKNTHFLDRQSSLYKKDNGSGDGKTPPWFFSFSDDFLIKRSIILGGFHSYVWGQRDESLFRPAGHMLELDLQCFAAMEARDGSHSGDIFLQVVKQQRSTMLWKQSVHLIFIKFHKYLVGNVPPMGRGSVRHQLQWWFNCDLTLSTDDH